MKTKTKQKNLISSPRPTKELTSLTVNKMAIPKGPTETFNFEFWDLRLFQWGSRPHNLKKKNAKNVPKTHAWSGKDDRECNYTLGTHSRHEFLGPFLACFGFFFFFFFLKMIWSRTP
ncbi:unnamed protein product [Meganyctiphanes norvegica]|uniref:Uncharacterized protein n=1 Tax=Meganyctiphanes norvegica TaxID=48144 RepID=A0AAV2PYL3_MEGNR